MMAAISLAGEEALLDFAHRGSCKSFPPPALFNPFSSLAMPHVYPAGPCEKVSFISLTFFSSVNIGSWRSLL